MKTDEKVVCSASICTNKATFSVNDDPTCANHLASAVRFTLGLQQDVYQSYKGVTVNGIS